GSRCRGAVICSSTTIGAGCGPVPPPVGSHRGRTPVLYLDSPIELHGLTVFRDYNEPNTFHYMPGNPEISNDGGEQAFQLLIYRRDITDNPDFNEGDRPGGGFLTMTVDLGVSTGTLDAVRRELGSRVSSGEVNLVP